jgi:predicted GIY-YIG superfamily endonuclease
MTTVYILLCQGNRYYVGKTDRPLESRIEEHFTNNGSEWTKRYMPIRVVQVVRNVDGLDEDRYTKIYMRRYGIDRVRGDSYTMCKLPDYK